MKVPDYELDVFDLIDEMTQLGEFKGRAEARRVDVNDFNHALLENEVDEFENRIDEAIDLFVEAVDKRRMQVWYDLENKGVVVK